MIKLLTYPIIETNSTWLAYNLPFQFKFGTTKNYALSILGIINGILPLFGIVLILKDNKLCIEKKWW